MAKSVITPHTGCWPTKENLDTTELSEVDVFGFRSGTSYEIEFCSFTCQKKCVNVANASFVEP